jgi:hypothetical protein
VNNDQQRELHAAAAKPILFVNVKINRVLSNFYVTGEDWILL